MDWIRCQGLNAGVTEEKSENEIARGKGDYVVKGRSIRSMLTSPMDDLQKFSYYISNHKQIFLMTDDRHTLHAFFGALRTCFVDLIHV
jgi:hypothetical protein